jgi:hypothetical protein
MEIHLMEKFFQFLLDLKIFWNDQSNKSMYLLEIAFKQFRFN